MNTKDAYRCEACGASVKKPIVGYAQKLYHDAGVGKCGPVVEIEQEVRDDSV